MVDYISITDSTTIAEIDEAIARLSVWRHGSEKAAAQVEMLLEVRFARTTGAKV